MSRINSVSVEFIDLLPAVLIDGVIYVSIEHRTIVHNCCSGCGERVVIGIGPAEWNFTYNGESISIDPSISNGAITCNSHYWIRNNRVIWAKPLSAKKTQSSQLRDRLDISESYRIKKNKKRLDWSTRG